MGWRRVVAQGSLGIWLVACAGSVRSGPSETIRVFGAADTPITATGVTADEDGWRIEARCPQHYGLRAAGHKPATGPQARFRDPCPGRPHRTGGE